MVARDQAELLDPVDRTDRAVVLDDQHLRQRRDGKRLGPVVRLDGEQCLILERCPAQRMLGLLALALPQHPEGSQPSELLVLHSMSPLRTRRQGTGARAVLAFPPLTLYRVAM
ncbi:MAG: hypothetical protein ABI330_13930 [Caldimonas sp.]